MLPGAVYEADYQCNWILPGSRRCRVDLADFCTMLACGKEGESTCESDGNPPADGTKCGENKVLSYYLFTNYKTIFCVYLVVLQE